MNIYDLLYCLRVAYSRMFADDANIILGASEMDIKLDETWSAETIKLNFCGPSSMMRVNLLVETR